MFVGVRAYSTDTPVVSFLASGMAMGVNPERRFVGISTLSMQMVRTNAVFMPCRAFGAKVQIIFLLR